MNKQNSGLPHLLTRLYKSIWLFPALATLALIVLTALNLNGSSMAVYYQYFYGTDQNPSVVLNRPRTIRSDEWVVNTQMTIAQSKDAYQRVNHDIGNGQDMSVVIDVPYKDWSTLFKPHNWSFFILPFSYAFAFKWWLMGYLLVISCYFFVIAILPRRRLLASVIALSLLLTPFVQWWYQYITLGPIYYSLFIATALVHIFKQPSKLKRYLLAGAIAYLLVCFALVLYPPFQIACALALLAFAAGLFIQYYIANPSSRKQFWSAARLVVAAGVVAGGLTGLFLLTRMEVVKAIAHTSYPGARHILSGGFSPTHIVAGQLAPEFQSGSRAAYYQIPTSGLTNQCESSNFLLLLPFLLLPIAFMMWRSWKAKRQIDWPLLAVCLAFIVFVTWMLVPHLNFLGTLLQLNKVPHTRLLIGLGLLNLIGLVLYIRHTEDSKESKLPHSWIAIYAAVVLLFELALNFYMERRFPGFMGPLRAIAFALPVPAIIYLLLRRKYLLACLALLVFSAASTVFIHPLQHGTAILTDTAISRDIREINAKHPGTWVVEPGNLENFPQMNGAKSLTGVFAYPQLSLWRSIDNGKTEDVYNRYAHVNFVFDRDTNVQIPTKLDQPVADHFGVIAEACSGFVQQQHIDYALTEAPLSDSCAKLVKQVAYPAHTFYIYRLR